MANQKKKINESNSYLTMITNTDSIGSVFCWLANVWGRGSHLKWSPQLNPPRTRGEAVYSSVSAVMTSMIGSATTVLSSCIRDNMGVAHPSVTSQWLSRKINTWQQQQQQHQNTHKYQAHNENKHVSLLDSFALLIKSSTDQCLHILTSCWFISSIIYNKLTWLSCTVKFSVLLFTRIKLSLMVEVIKG